MASNPFVLTFGREPIQYIPRLDYFYRVENDFLSETRPNQIYMITGVRGSGKTVLLSMLAKRFEEKSDWIVIDLNPERDMLESFASQLYNSSKVKHLFLKIGFSLSFNGAGLSIENNKPSEDIETSINKMMEYLSKNGKNVLITLDDAVSNSNIKAFSHTFQSLIRKDYPIFLLMTGLYENITTIQNSKSLTFLSRAPKLVMTPLNLPAIKASYEDIFTISDAVGTQMAKLTAGYAYAFQLLGYLFWEEKVKDISKNLLDKYDQYLSEFVYDRMWDNIPEKERTVLENMTKNEKIEAIIEDCHISDKEFSVYRDRLIKRGIVIAKERGKLTYALPRFKEYLQTKELFI